MVLESCCGEKASSCGPAWRSHTRSHGAGGDTGVCAVWYSTATREAGPMGAIQWLQGGACKGAYGGTGGGERGDGLCMQGGLWTPDAEGQLGKRLAWAGGRARTATTAWQACHAFQVLVRAGRRGRAWQDLPTRAWLPRQGRGGAVSVGIQGNQATPNTTATTSSIEKRACPCACLNAPMACAWAYLCPVQALANHTPGAGA